MVVLTYVCMYGSDGLFAFDVVVASNSAVGSYSKVSFRNNVGARVHQQGCEALLRNMSYRLPKLVVEVRTPY